MKLATLDFTETAYRSLRHSFLEITGQYILRIEITESILSAFRKEKLYRKDYLIDIVIWVKVLAALLTILPKKCETVWVLLFWKIAETGLTTLRHSPRPLLLSLERLLVI